MADPISLTVAGSLIGAGGGIMGGMAQGQQYQYQAGIAQLNQKIALQNRDYALATGETEAARYGMGARQRMGTIKANIGAQGIDIGSGSKADVVASQQVVSDIDLSTIRNNAARKAYGFETEASQDAAQSQLYTSASKTAMTSGLIKAAGSLVSGSASVADKWLQGQSVGLYGSGDPGLGA